MREDLNAFVKNRMAERTPGINKLAEIAHDLNAKLYEMTLERDHWKEVASQASELLCVPPDCDCANDPPVHTDECRAYSEEWYAKRDKWVNMVTKK
jgi:hypothetical protein